jgi:hypothetical protein
MTIYNTLLLDQKAWDLVLDANGNIALASQPYSLAQDVASAVKLFIGELYYDTSKGIPYFEDVLGKLPPQQLLVGYVENAAKTVPGVAQARCVISSFKNDGSVTGQIQIIDDQGASSVLNF